MEKIRIPDKHHGSGTMVDRVTIGGHLYVVVQKVVGEEQAAPPHLSAHPLEGRGEQVLHPQHRLPGRTTPRHHQVPITVIFGILL